MGAGNGGAGGTAPAMAARGGRHRVPAWRGEAGTGAERTAERCPLCGAAAGRACAVSYATGSLAKGVDVVV
ncbi:hypothetical protein M3650_25145 [Paenibacillus sp. MER TA 81-3]|nr:hypothetical protein [Paenibacillus sp. MER TA 81-3]MCM3341823.1 hypothetical protein [Paenibacillus sp. MER TA 81-3]